MPQPLDWMNGAFSMTGLYRRRSCFPGPSTDHGLVVYRQQLLADAASDWMEARARAAGQYDALKTHVIFRLAPLGRWVLRPLCDRP
jgi:hypothetical protein